MTETDPAVDRMLALEPLADRDPEYEALFEAAWQELEARYGLGPALERMIYDPRLAPASVPHSDLVLEALHGADLHPADRALAEDRLGNLALACTSAAALLDALRTLLGALRSLDDHHGDPVAARYADRLGILLAEVRHEIGESPT